MYRGKVIGEYSYDAWGNVTTIIHEDTNPNEVDRKIVGINPYRYKGYYMDIETGLYYCNARYYDPKIYQWIQRDNIEYLDNESLDGLNLYLYCNNDPVNLSDPEGHFPWLILIAAVLLFTPVGGTITQVATSAVSYAGMAVASIFDKDIRNDMNAIGWNPFNTNESATLNSSKVSFYKGVPVLQISEMGGSMSLGIIFFDKSQGVEVLKHERGHNTQLMSMGLGNFLIKIGIPSVLINEDETPWELSASMLGDSSLANDCSEEQKRKAYKYYIRSCFPIVNVL